MVSIYLKIKNILGDVTARPYDGWIKCETFWYGEINVGRGNFGAGMGKNNQNTLFATLYFSKANRDIVQASADGRSFDEVDLAAKKGKAEVLRLTMKEVLLGSI